MRFGLDGVERRVSRLRFAHIFLAPVYFIVFINALNSYIPVTIAAIAFYYIILQLGVVLVYLFMRLIRIERDAAFFFSTMTLFIFFSCDTMKGFGLKEIYARWYLYGVVWVLFWGCICVTIKRMKLNKLNSVLSVALVILVVVNACNIISSADLHAAKKGSSVDIYKNIGNDVAKRSIYHIYLDGFARKDVMENLYGEKKFFLEDALKQLGFIVVEGSNANYTETVYSISSTLNMDYFENYKEEQNVRYHSDMSRSICNSNTLRMLKNLGYSTVAFNSGAYYNLEPAVDEYRDPVKNKLYRNMLLDSVYFRVLRHKAVYWPAALDKQLSFGQIHAARILNMFEDIENLSTKTGNYYFIHFVCPHPPFVFDENGNPVEDAMGRQDLSDGFNYTNGDDERVENYRALYRKQAVFVAKRVVALVKGILQKSEVKPIIIIQSDHGPGSRWRRSSFADTDMLERKAIVNAYYFPDIALNLSRDFSPVNTYRLLFNSYFGGNYDYLPNRTFFLEGKRYISLPRFIEVDERNQRVEK